MYKVHIILCMWIVMWKSIWQFYASREFIAARDDHQRPAPFPCIHFNIAHREYHEYRYVSVHKPTFIWLTNSTERNNKLQFIWSPTWCFQSILKTVFHFANLHNEAIPKTDWSSRKLSSLHRLARALCETQAWIMWLVPSLAIASSYACRLPHKTKQALQTQPIHAVELNWVCPS